MKVVQFEWKIIIINKQNDYVNHLSPLGYGLESQSRFQHHSLNICIKVLQIQKSFAKISCHLHRNENGFSVFLFLIGPLIIKCYSHVPKTFFFTKYHLKKSISSKRTTYMRDGIRINKLKKKTYI